MQHGVLVGVHHLRGQTGNFNGAHVFVHVLFLAGGVGHRKRRIGRIHGVQNLVIQVTIFNIHGHVRGRFLIHKFLRIGEIFGGQHEFAADNEVRRQRNGNVFARKLSLLVCGFNCLAQLGLVQDIASVINIGRERLQPVMLHGRRAQGTRQLDHADLQRSDLHSDRPRFLVS